VATRKPKPQKKKTMYILLAILKFLLAKSLKFSQKKNRKKRLISVIMSDFLTSKTAATDPSMQTNPINFVD
jgi:hypothetical protein